MDWSLLGCGRSGHVSYAPDEPAVRARLRGQTWGGEAWQCLRCGAFVPGPAGARGPVGDAPQVRRDKEVRSALILRLFAIERFLRALAFFAVAYGLWRFRSARQSIDAAFDRELPILRELFSQLGYQVDHSKLFGLVEHALTLSNHTITLLAIGLAAYAAVEVVEGTGLWLARRWGEYFAMIATSAGLPLEIYDLSNKVTITTLIFFAINLALVLYLVLAKRLFGVRGGKRAYDARLRSESIMEAAVASAAAEDAEVTPEREAGGASEAGGPGRAGGPSKADGPGEAGGAHDAGLRHDAGGSDEAAGPDEAPPAAGAPAAFAVHVPPDARAPRS